MDHESPSQKYPTPATNSEETPGVANGGDPGINIAFDIASPTANETNDYAIESQRCEGHQYGDLCSKSFQLQQDTLRDSLLELYYSYFHVSHPCVVPLRFLKEKIPEYSPGLHVLVNVLQFVGSLYVEDTASEPFEHAILMHLPAENSVWGPCEVQAILIYAVALFWRNELEKAREMMNLCIRKAVAMGMHQREFATTYSAEDPVFAESWRRTWYEIYLCDASMTATSRSSTFVCSLRSLSSTVDLPCEETDYNDGVSRCTKLLIFC